MDSILDRICGPGDVAALSQSEKDLLAREVRQRIIDVVCCTGGHLASSLGVVELTVALLSVYNPEVDRIIWDVGHQTYPWKLLTGRRNRFHTVRQAGGLSGFPKRDESVCDCFGTGHSSTSISAALGFAMARDLRGEHHRVLAVIGDGSMTAGLAFEGLNNLGQAHTDMTVILNDNRMSISPNVGAISRHFMKLITDPRYNRLKDEVWNTLGKVPTVGNTMRRAAGYAGAAVKKTIVNPVNVFDEFGVRYIGPVDGHDLPLLTAVLARVKELHGPVLVHVVTKKGKGYEPAECEPVDFHGISGASGATPGQSFTSVFGGVLTDMARSDRSLVAITAAMPDGTGLSCFAAAHPDRFFDVGIAEQHAVTFACGLAFGGLKPVVAIYSSFFQRSFDQLVHDAALQNAPVLFALDRAGIVGADGPTHHGVHDIAMFRQVPGTALAAPRDCGVLEALLEGGTARAFGAGRHPLPQGSRARKGGSAARRCDSRQGPAHKARNRCPHRGRGRDGDTGRESVGHPGGTGDKRRGLRPDMAETRAHRRDTCPGTERQVRRHRRGGLPGRGVRRGAEGFAFGDQGSVPGHPRRLPAPRQPHEHPGKGGA